MIKYKSHNQKKNEENNDIWKKTTHLICYDIILCLYFLVFAFEIAWNIVGHNWVAGQDCSESSLLAMTIVALILMWVFLGLSFFMFFCTIITLACEEGSCGGKCCEDLCHICACFCCPSKPKENKIARNNREVPNNNNNKSPPTFIGSGIGLLRMLGINIHSKNQQNNQAIAQSENAQNQQQPAQINTYGPQQVYQNQGIPQANYISTDNQGALSSGNYQPQYQVPQSYPYVEIPIQQLDGAYHQELNPPKEGIFAKIKKKLKLS